MKSTVYHCDACNAVISDKDNRLTFRENKDRKTLCFGPWPEHDESDDKHLCSQECAVKVLQRHMETLHQ